MKKTLLLIGLAASFVMTGCASYNPLTEKDGYYKDYTAITNYDRIVLTEPKISVKIVNNTANNTELLDPAIIKKHLTTLLAKKGIATEFSESAQYVISVNKIQRSEKKNLTGFNPVPSSLASNAHKVTGSTNAGAAGLGAGLLANALIEKRMWEVDFSILDNGNEHTRYYRLVPAAADKQGLNGTITGATAEFFELKK